MYVIISFLLISIFNVYRDYENPSCVEAQTSCLPFAPQVGYGRWPDLDTDNFVFVDRTGITAGTCDTQPIDVFLTPPPAGTQYRGTPIVTITGWDILFNQEGGGNDNHISRERVRVSTTPTFIAGGTGIRFNVEVCLHDQANDNGWRDDWQWAVRYVAGAWYN